MSLIKKQEVCGGSAEIHVSQKCEGSNMDDLYFGDPRIISSDSDDGSGYRVKSFPPIPNQYVSSSVLNPSLMIILNWNLHSVKRIRIAFND